MQKRAIFFNQTLGAMFFIQCTKINQNHQNTVIWFPALNSSFLFWKFRSKFCICHWLTFRSVPNTIKNFISFNKSIIHNPAQHFVTKKNERRRQQSHRYYRNWNKKDKCDIRCNFKRDPTFKFSYKQLICLEIVGSP